MTSPSNANTPKLTRYVLPKDYIVHVEGFPAILLHDSLIESGTKLPLDTTHDDLATALARTFSKQRAKDLQKISFYAGIPVEVLEGYLRSKDE